MEDQGKGTLGTEPRDGPPPSLGSPREQAVLPLTACGCSPPSEQMELGPRPQWTKEVVRAPLRRGLCPHVPDLHLHGLLHPGRDMDVFDLIAQAADAPIIGGLVDGVHNAGIEGFPLLEGTERQGAISPITGSPGAKLVKTL